MNKVYCASISSGVNHKEINLFLLECKLLSGGIPRMCNELKLSRQLKIEKLRERSQIGDFYTQFALPDSAKGKQTKHRDSSGSTPDKPK
ncbi:hypothetical protein H5410_052230 [Solanum commersonii]|uniref:Uncharacterized protein n=1 Tax=Solanum commersonii TaxID=4109 RepID=A0A9J5X0J8_SOLCO|nr:hypothetical protein H5410_052230 [Solanum commersonii]